MREKIIVSACRTLVGSFLGALSSLQDADDCIMGKVLPANFG